MKNFFFLLLLAFSFTARADFFIARTTANLRAAANSNSEILEKVKQGDTLTILNKAEQGEYRYVRSLMSGQNGWVSISLFTRVAGEIPGKALEKDYVGETGVVDIRVLDIGNGLCTLIKLPGNKYVIYDAGGKSKNKVFQYLQDYIPTGSQIEFMVLSHTDADHINAAAAILRGYKVKKVIWGGFDYGLIGREPTDTYKILENALRSSPATENFNLRKRNVTLSPGIDTVINGAKFTFLCGFSKPMTDWDVKGDSEKLNAVSIVMKVVYGKGSVLFCGDAVGRHLSDKIEKDAIATEKYLLANAGHLLPSKIILAPHHGARNGSSKQFIEAVAPEYVIFSSGSGHAHPDPRTGNMYLEYVNPLKIFRTDLGENEEGEWMFRTDQPIVTDPLGDDNVQIQLMGNGKYRVFYVR